LSPGAEGTAGILIENVVHSYRATGKSLTVLDRISLSIKRGEFVALVGPSGCGKTTLLDILSGLVELQRGRVVVGHSPPAVGRPDTARMFARDALLPWRTAYANVDFAMATRNPDRYGIANTSKYITYGASPRATIHLVEGARALAYLRNRNYVLPQDVIDIAPDVLRHRLSLSYEALSDALTPDQIILRIMKHIPAPEKPLETHVRVDANA